MAQPPIFINAADLAGVDDETYRAADAGDRQAQKKMLRGLMTNEASPLALISGHWTDWMLRMVAAGSKQATSDVLGAIAEAARQGSISAPQKAALDTLFEQYFGPGDVGAVATNLVLGAFCDDAHALTVLRIFLLGDRLNAGDASVTLDEINAARESAAELGSDPAEAFFMAVWAQHSYPSDPMAACEAALAAIEKLSPFVADDPIYKEKIGLYAILASQLADIAGDSQASLLLRVTYAEQIALYNESNGAE